MHLHLHSLATLQSICQYPFREAKLRPMKRKGPAKCRK